MKKIGILANPRKEQVPGHLNELNQWIAKIKPKAEFFLCRYESEYLENSYSNIELVPEKEVLSFADLIVTLGGDGTILRAVAAIGDKAIPILGVNLGGLGFLAETAPDMLTHHLDAYLKGQCYIEERATMQCRVLKDDHVCVAFNDLVVDKAGFYRVIEIVTYVDNCLLNSYIADAMIISTPTGSTGYSLSAGGPIVIPQTEVFIINPICPHSLTNRPVVIPDSSIITLEVFTEHTEINTVRDGRMDKSYPSGTAFEITKGEHKVKLVKMEKNSFYETIRNKLHWGEDFRDKNRWSYKNSKPGFK